MKGWRHAFALDDPADPLTEKEEALIERIAQGIARRRLSSPAILFLESLRPLHYIGSQAMVFFAPVVKALVKGKDYDTATGILERRTGVERLLQRIEALEEEGSHA